jgi:hypothetical protein
MRWTAPALGIALGVKPQGMQRQQPDDEQERTPGTAGQKATTGGVKRLADERCPPDAFEPLAEVEILCAQALHAPRCSQRSPSGLTDAANGCEVAEKRGPLRGSFRAFGAARPGPPGGHRERRQGLTIQIFWGHQGDQLLQLLAVVPPTIEA